MAIDKIGASPGTLAASGLKVQQARMRIIAENLANTNSTGTTPGAEPYRRQVPVLKATLIDGAMGVAMAQIKTDSSDFKLEYDPSHPAADTKGYVKMPNVTSLIETMDMRDAMRAYEANLNVIETGDAMDKRTIDLLKK